MSAEIINLRRARKAKDRVVTDKKAEANRLLFGRTKVEKSKTKAENELAAAKLGSHRRTPDAEG